MVSSLEKQSFKASQFEAAKGGTATDVLKNIPSVTVNAEGEITVRGSKGFLILVNGKPSQIDAATLLSQIPANTIEKIEMITAPLPNMMLMEKLNYQYHNQNRYKRRHFVVNQFTIWTSSYQKVL
jgi:hypothetical protein